MALLPAPAPLPFPMMAFSVVGMIYPEACCSRINIDIWKSLK